MPVEPPEFPQPTPTETAVVRKPLVKVPQLETESERAIGTFQSLIQLAEEAEKSGSVSINLFNQYGAAIRKHKEQLAKEQGVKTWDLPRTKEIEELECQIEIHRATYFGEQHRAVVIYREALSQYTRQDQMPDRPWVEPRKVRGLPEVPMASRTVYVGGLPEERLEPSAQRAGKFFNAKIKHYLPSVEYAEYFKDVEHRGAVDLSNEELEVFGLMQELLIPFEDPDDHVPNWFDWRWLAWARATKIVGLDPMVDKIHGRKAIHTRPETPEPPRLSTREELFATRERVFEEIVGRDKGRPMSDKEKSHELWTVLCGVRYNMDHQTGVAELTLSELLDLYSELNFVQETEYPTGPWGTRPEYPLFAQLNSLARVTMGGRMEQYYDGTPLLADDNDAYFDEVDAIFFAAVHILGELSPNLNQCKKAMDEMMHGRYYKMPRFCLYETGGESAHDYCDPIGLAISMGMQYFRMDDKLRQRWNPMLLPLFKLVEDKIRPLIGTKPTLVVAGTVDDGTEHHGLGDGKERLKGPEEAQTLIEVQGALRGKEHAELHYGGKQLVGPGAEAFQQVVVPAWDRDPAITGSGITHSPAYIKLIPLDQPERKLHQELTLRLTASERLPKEEAKLIHEVAADPEAGNFDKLGAVKRIVERLTGRTIDDLDVTHILTALGHLKQMGAEAKKLPHDQLRGFLFEAQEGGRAFADLDRTTQLLVMLRATNILPKELVVEQLVQSLAGAAPISMLRLMVSMEDAANNNATSAEGLFEFPVFAGRDTVAAAREKFGAEAPQFRKAVVETFTQFLSYLQVHWDYESSIDDLLTMFEVMERTGQPMSQCGEMAAVASEMMNWMMGQEKPTSFTAYRERFHNLPLGEWLKKVQEDDAGGTFDHVKIWSELPSHEEQERRLVTDQTTGHTWFTNQTKLDLSRTRAMKQGEYRSVIDSEIANLDYAGRQIGRENVSEGALVYGSKSGIQDVSLPFLYDIVCHIPSLHAYAEAMAPDNPHVLRSRAFLAVSNRERMAHLNRLLEIAPRQLADDHSGEPKHQQMQLLEFARTCIAEHAPGQALFLLHISHSVAERNLQPEMAKTAEALSRRVHSLWATQEEPELEHTLLEAEKNGWVLPQDITAIWAQREALQKEQEELARSKNIRPIDAAAQVMRRVEEVCEKQVVVSQQTVLSLPKDEERSGLGDGVGSELKTEMATAGAECRRDHQVELPAGASQLMQRFVQASPDGAGFAIAEATRGLGPDEKRQMLMLMEVVLLESEQAFGLDMVPGLVTRSWEGLAAAVGSQKLTLPYSRDELKKHLPDVKRELQLAGGVAANLLTAAK